MAISRWPTRVVAATATTATTTGTTTTAATAVNVAGRPLDHSRRVVGVAAAHRLFGKLNSACAAAAAARSAAAVSSSSKPRNNRSAIRLISGELTAPIRQTELFRRWRRSIKMLAVCSREIRAKGESFTKFQEISTKATRAVVAHLEFTSKVALLYSGWRVFLNKL